LLRGRFGVAAETGHFTVVPDGRRCGCGNQGCWEQYASGRALVAEARAVATASPAIAATLLALAGGRVRAIDDRMVTAAAREGDEAAPECFRIVGTWLGRGIADLAAILDPGVSIIAGGVSRAGELIRKPARQTYLPRLTAAPIARQLTCGSRSSAATKPVSSVRPCGCRKPHPCRSCGLFVLVDDAAETVASLDVESGESVRMGDRLGE
jgi:predicted NBD/HSP70 family sugar kinase